MIVEVKPIIRPRWYKDPEKARLFSRPRVIKATVDTQKGMYKVDIPEKRLKQLEKITGYDLSLTFVPGRPHPFWDGKLGEVKLEHKTNIFNTENILHEIALGILKASKWVANSLEEYENGEYPEADFYIFNQEEEIKQKVSKAKLRKKAYNILSKLTTERKKAIAQILYDELYEHQSEDYVEGKLYEALEDDALLERFVELAEMDAEDVVLYNMVIEASYKGILTRRGHSVYFMDERIGYDVMDAINYLKDEDNQSVKIMIMERLQELK